MRREEGMTAGFLAAWSEYLYPFWKQRVVMDDSRLRGEDDLDW
jgi:hypothetical protein